MNRKRITCTVASITVAGIAVAIIVSWPHIRESYYRKQLESASGEEAWELAAKVASFRSRHAEDWYLAKLEDDDWDVRVRAAKSLVGIGTERAIGSVLTLNHPALEQTLAEFGQPDPLGVRERHSARELRSEDLVLRGKVLVAEQDLFLDVTSDERERFDGFHGLRFSESLSPKRIAPHGEPLASPR